MQIQLNGLDLKSKNINLDLGYSFKWT